MEEILNQLKNQLENVEKQSSNKQSQVISNCVNIINERRNKKSIDPIQELIQMSLNKVKK